MRAVTGTLVDSLIVRDGELAGLRLRRQKDGKYLSLTVRACLSRWPDT